ncbi:MAG: acyl-CoA reductase [Chitinophagaceae bacterium]
MNLQERIEILSQLGEYIRSSSAEWQMAKDRAYSKNNWFTPEFVDLASNAIADAFLQKEQLQQWARHYHLDDQIQPKTVGIVMAGNIPLVGFHDFLAVFLSGHKQVCKLSSKDDVLLRHLVDQLIQWNPDVASVVSFADMLKNCHAYIATGSDNSARYFEYYFGRYPSVIRKNRTSVAILSGAETAEQLEALSDDIMQYFGLGCRNITKLYVPENYDFVPLLNALKKYISFFEHHKYRSNYDYQLAIYIMNNLPYMTNDCLVMVENKNLFSPIGTLHYEFYTDADALYKTLKADEKVQAVVGAKGLSFGQAQKPGLMDYADGVDVMQFLLTL